jgi:teichuronic acid biosynthesis glycosyltransferase TuaC
MRGQFRMHAQPAPTVFGLTSFAPYREDIRMAVQDIPRATPPIRIVTFTTLYPNAAQPAHGVFVENRLRHLVASGRVTSRVLAPVPWFPRALAGYSSTYSRYAAVPFAEQRYDLPIIHPRFPAVPKFGMTVAPALLFARSLWALRCLRAESGDFDLIDAHYFYPDGVAAVMLGKAVRKPVVITARGSDVNLISRYQLPRSMIRYAAGKAAGIITVSQALKNSLVALGVPMSKVDVLRNGVDLEMFRPVDRSLARARLEIHGLTLLSVGNLVELKGHDLVIGALPFLPNYSLIIVGEGPERFTLQRLAVRLGVSSRVRFLGRIPHEQLADVYSAADALVLASSREGWPNVLLEAMACGTPVIASNIGGIPELLKSPAAGEMAPERSSRGFATTITKLFHSLPDRAATRRYAENFSWDETTEGQIKLFSQILAQQPDRLVSSGETR